MSRLLGGIFILAGVLGLALHHWITTRSYFPVDMPASFGVGHIRTGPFRIDLPETYRISLAREPKLAGYGECLDRLRTQWIVYKQGRVVAESGPDRSFFGDTPEFYAERGIYNLDLEVLTDVSCLDPFHPRLTVRTDRSGYDSFASILLWACTLCVGTGASLLVITAVRLNPRRYIPLTPFAEPDKARVALLRRVSPQKWRPFSAAAWFGLIAVNIYAPVLFVMIVLHDDGTEKRAGLPVRIVRTERASQPIAGLEPVVVRMGFAAGDPHPELHINSTLVPWENFELELEKAITRRPPGWPVYLEGDNNLDWESVTGVISIIRGLHAQVTLVPRRRGVVVKR